MSQAAEDPRAVPAPVGWLVVIDAQRIFADPASPWASPMWSRTVGHIRDLVTEFGDRVVFTRFVARPALGGSWEHYYREWEFALVSEQDPLYEIVPELADLVERTVTAGTFGKWNADLQELVGSQGHVNLVGVSTDCCVLSTALAAADAGATVQVLADGCAGSTPQNHRRALDAMALYGPQITIV